MDEEKKSNFEEFHDKNYKLLLLIPAILFVLSIAYIGVFYSNNGDFMHKDISLTGGTTITIYEDIDVADMMLSLEGKLENLNTRTVYDIVSREEKAITIETTSDGETARNAVEEYLGHELTSENSSFEFTGSTLSESFYKQLVIAILVAFIFMAIVVFILFRTLVPSLAVIFAALADIIMTLAVVDLLGMKLSSAGIVAFLMLIGYSVDTDILLTTRMLKRHKGSLNERLFGAFKTGTTMTITSLLAITFALLIISSFSFILSQIFTILVIGLLFDLLNTWITNVSILKWYVEAKK
jgi:preprotein translocase subunit SecF